MRSNASCTRPWMRRSSSRGRSAPAFELKDLKGKTHKLADFKDKILVIEWTEPGCPYIVKHAREGTMKSIKKGAPWRRRQGSG